MKNYKKSPKASRPQAVKSPALVAIGTPDFSKVPPVPYIFGLTQKEIFARCSALLNAGIDVVDVGHAEDNIHDIQRRAFSALHAAAPIRNRRVARRRGSMGGLAKAAAAQADRATQISPDIARRLCASSLSWKEKADILGMPLSTVQRHYGVRKTKT